MSDVTFKNNSGSNITLVLPDGRQDTFPTGNIRTYMDTGMYSVKDGPDPVYSFTYDKGSFFINLNGIAIGGSVSFNNRSGITVMVILPDGPEPDRVDLQHGHNITFKEPGTYTCQSLLGTPLFSFKYTKGTIITDIIDISSDISKAPEN
ncbi:hypothetical protein F5148DRAFT_1283349 [Russula earlei]|uniref:Uncharacterized protein n=1 Tax=Russula earlei TaxID=71964 RepID=A0ACC0UBK5_9AGAM|nr:hypothetical protein F5148DRAFT_1283349 [Russula earlei]